MFIRGFAALLCGLTVLNLIARCLGPGRDCSLWWIDLRPAPAWIATLIELCATVALAVLALGGSQLPWLRRSAAATFIVLAAFAVVNTFQFYAVTVHGLVSPGVWLPLSALAACMLVWASWRSARSSTPTE